MNFIRNIFGHKNPETRVFDISLVKMQKAFDQMQQEVGWDTKKKLVWGYYFLDHDLKRLEAFARLLKKQGYKFPFTTSKSLPKQLILKE